MRRTTLMTVIAVVGSGFCAPSAGAWTASESAGRLAITAGPGERNQFSLVMVSGAVQVTDGGGAAVDVTIPGSCTRPVATRVLCSGVTAVAVEAGDLDDTVSDATGLAGSVLSGGDGDDQLFGGAQADQLIGGAGRDALWGGGDDDTLDGGSGDDELHGGSGADLLIGGAGNDHLFGEDDADAIQGGSGDDELVGGEGADTISGGEGADDIDGEAGTDLIDGGADPDTISGGANGDTISGGDGDDHLLGQDGADVISGGAGADVIDAGDGADTLRGDDGPDAISGGTGADTLDGGAGADTLDGGTEADALTGGDDDDQLAGGDGADQLDGGGGSDALIGGDGADVLDGADGDDELRGGPAADVLRGGGGDDRLDGGIGGDQLIGGGGIDTADYSARLTSVTVTIGSVAGADDGEAAERDDVDSSIERIFGGVGADVLDAFAAPGSVELFGGSGDDWLRGGGGDDRLDGGAGNDVLSGGLGADRLDGGDGEDVASYRERTGPVVVSLDGLANDGASSEGDLVRTEDVASGSGDDILIGGPGVNVLDAGAGDDWIVAAGDPGVGDTLHCGDGTDRFDADEDDLLGVDCEIDVSAAAASAAETERRAASGAQITARSLTLRRRGAAGIIRAAVLCRPRTDAYCRVRLGLVVGKGRRAVTMRWTELTVLPGHTRVASIRVSSSALRRLRRLPGASRRRAVLRVLSYDRTDQFARQAIELRLRGSLSA